MVWNLILAHFLGDFVFQNDWMVRKRDNFWMLTLHASIHFALMFFLVGQFRLTVWPYLLLLAMIHRGQDRIKIYLTKRRPDWTGKAFIVDQALHFAAIWILVWYFRTGAGLFFVQEKPVWAIVATTYLFVTYVWFISERVFNLSNTDYLEIINTTKFPRMLTRVGLVSVFLLVRITAISGLAIIFTTPYPQSKFRQRALLTDVSVSFLAMIFLIWVLR